MELKSVDWSARWRVSERETSWGKLLAVEKAHFLAGAMVSLLDRGRVVQKAAWTADRSDGEMGCQKELRWAGKLAVESEMKLDGTGAL